MYTHTEQVKCSVPHILLFEYTIMYSNGSININNDFSLIYKCADNYMNIDLFTLL